MPLPLAATLFASALGLASGLSGHSRSKSDSQGVETRPSSPVSVAPSRLTPLQSDLAYLLHDNDEGIYDPSKTTEPIPVKYMVDNLSEYGKKFIPLKVYVSALPRTWQTAVLLYLPFLYNDKSTEYSQTLILEVSPFLLEGTSKNITKETTAVKKIKEKPVYEMNSNKPLDFKGNVEQFVNFIKLLIYFKKQETKFPTMMQEILSKIPTKFSIILIAGNEKVHLRVSIGSGTPETIEYYTSDSTIGSSFNPNSNSIKIPDFKLRKINKDIFDKIVTPTASDGNDKYESYSGTRLNPNNTPPQTIYTTFPMDALYFNNFENIGKFSPDIFSFLKWVIEIKSHPKNMPILFVSHSNTLREFLSLMVTNLNHDYEKQIYDSSSNFFPPSDLFRGVCLKVKETNTWSVRFTYLGYNVTGFRHAQSCDNIYETLSSSKRLGKKVLKAVTLGGVKAKDFYYREKYGDYTNLSLWGIFSTLIFGNKNKDVISNFTDKIKESGLLVMRGMKKQTEENIKAFGLDNELTCGDISTRFTIPTDGGAGSNFTNVVDFKFKLMDKYLDIIPYSLPLNDISVTARQQMANILCSYDNVFHITFERCIVVRGCSLSVAYIGNYNFGDITLENIKIVNKRRIGIRINESGGNINLVLSKVNPGGVVADKSGNIDSTSFFERKFLELSGKEDKTFTSSSSSSTLDDKQKIQLSDNFQKFVSFLLGLDVIQASVLTYDTLYNISIFYSNLLLRMLRKAYLLSSANESTDTTFSTDSIQTTKDKLGPESSKNGINSDALYGGKNSNESN